METLYRDTRTQWKHIIYIYLNVLTSKIKCNFEIVFSIAERRVLHNDTSVNETLVVVDEEKINMTTSIDQLTPGKTSLTLSFSVILCEFHL